MLRNYLLSAFRNAVGHKLYSFINVAGLAVALVAAILIGLYVKEELSFDSWLQDSGQLYRVDITWQLPGQEPVNNGAAPIPLGPTLKSEIAGVTEQTRVLRRSVTIEAGHERFLELVNVVDPNFFSVIRLPFINGDPATVLKYPDAVVLSETAVHKYFGTSDPIGRTLLINGETHTVRGILRDLPYNTQFTGDVFFPYVAPPVSPEETARQWTANPAWTYLRLAPGVDRHVIGEAIPKLYERHLPPELRLAFATVVHSSLAKIVVADAVPLRDVHLTADLRGGMKPGNSRSVVYGFAAIAGLILLIACVNFTNLATARAFLRSREVGLRKVVGARRTELVTQFLFESIVSALIAVAIALAVVEILLPLYGRVLGHAITFNYLHDWQFTVGTLVITLACGVLGGFYPAIVLSGFRAAAALRPAAISPVRSGLFRNALVVFQFTVSIGLGIAALVVFAQIDYARRIDPGFNRDNVVVLDLGRSELTPEGQATLARTLAGGPAIDGSALSITTPGETRYREVNFADVPGNPYKIAVQSMSVSPDFFTVYGIKLIAGRLFSHSRGNDVNGGTGLENNKSIIIDEDAARAFGFNPENAIGKSIDLVGSHATVVGVVRNALFQGAYAVSTKATVYYYNPNHMTRLSIRVKSGRVPEALAFIDTTWRRFVPASPVSRWFLDERFGALYADSERQGMQLDSFVAIAIVIACLGLFGLAAFTAERRTREIGIRKVMGARTRDIVRLLVWQFSIPVLVANVIAWPVAWYYLRQWLDGYAHRIELNPLYFVAAGAVALLIAWLTVIGHAVRVARANPVHALRYE